MEPEHKRVSDKWIIVRTAIPAVVIYLYVTFYNFYYAITESSEFYFDFEIFAILYMVAIFIISIANGLSNGKSYFWFSLLAIPAGFVGYIALQLCSFFFFITFFDNLSI